MLSESDKTADHEMRSSDHGRFYCVCFARVRSVTTALSGESGAAIWPRSDRNRKGFDPTFCKTSDCYSATVIAVSPLNAGSRLRAGPLSLLFQLFTMRLGDRSNLFRSVN